MTRRRRKTEPPLRLRAAALAAALVLVATACGGGNDDTSASQAESPTTTATAPVTDPTVPEAPTSPPEPTAEPTPAPTATAAPTATVEPTETFASMTPEQQERIDFVCGRAADSGTAIPGSVMAFAEVAALSLQVGELGSTLEPFGIRLAAVAADVPRDLTELPPAVSELLDELVDACVDLGWTPSPT